MVNIIANRRKAGVPRLKGNDDYFLHYSATNFQYKPWTTEMMATNIFPVDTLHFPNGQWYWARIVTQVDDGTTVEGDMYLFDPGFKPTDPDAGKAYDKWAEVYNYDGEIRAYIGSENVDDAIYGGDVVDSYETNDIDSGVAWVNRTMLDFVNTIASRHKAGVPRIKDNGEYDLHYSATNFQYKPWTTEMQATNIFPVDTLHFPNGQWYWARRIQDDDGTTVEGDMYLFDPGFKEGDPDAGKAYDKWAEINNYDGEIWAYIGSENVDDAIYGGDEVDSYTTNSIDDAVAWVNRTMLDFVNEH